MVLVRGRGCDAWVQNVHATPFAVNARGPRPSAAWLTDPSIFSDQSEWQMNLIAGRRDISQPPKGKAAVCLL
jgi:hypothetical protein